MTEEDTDVLRERVSQLELDLERAREALEELYDWQNGLPLLTRKWEDGWNGAMQKAAKVLGREHHWEKGR